MAYKIKYINSGRLATLANTIAELEDEFKVCRRTGQTDRAEHILTLLAPKYKFLMWEVKKQNLSRIEITNNNVQITYKRP